MQQGEKSGFFRSTFEEPHDVVTQHLINYEAVMHRPASASREATLSSNKEAPSDNATRSRDHGNVKPRRRLRLGSGQLWHGSCHCRHTLR
jgi:hypothetical protein